MANSYRNYTDEDILEAVKNNKSLTGVLKDLNLKIAGGNYGNMKRNIQRLGADTSHWKGQGWNAGDRTKDWSEYAKSASIKPHLIEERSHCCEKCGLTKWLDEDIILEVHHLDGDRTNNVLENLQLFCPNCHALTDNWRGRKNKKRQGSPIGRRQAT